MPQPNRARYESNPLGRRGHCDPSAVTRRAGIPDAGRVTSVLLPLCLLAGCASPHGVAARGSPPTSIRLPRQSAVVLRLPTGEQARITKSATRTCVTVIELARSCGPRLTRRRPITFVVLTPRKSLGAFVFGTTRSNVTSISFEYGPRHIKLFVRRNLFSYRGTQPLTSGGISHVVVSFVDGSSEQFP